MSKIWRTDQGQTLNRLKLSKRRTKEIEEDGERKRRRDREVTLEWRWADVDECEGRSDGSVIESSSNQCERSNSTENNFESFSFHLRYLIIVFWIAEAGEICFGAQMMFTVQSGKWTNRGFNKLHANKHVALIIIMVNACVRVFECKAIDRRR